MIEPISIKFRERISANRAGEPLQFGVPFSQGEVKGAESFQLTGGNDTPLPVQPRPLAHWPDGSVRWMCFETLLPASNKPPETLTLSQNPGGEPGDSGGPDLLKTESQLQIRYEHSQLTVNHGSLSWQWDGTAEQPFLSALRLYDTEDKLCTARLDDGWQIERTGPVVTTVSGSGWWHNDLNKIARFRCQLSFYTNGLVSVDAMILNPHRARHRGGLWDLRDPGSVHFGGMAVETKIINSRQYRLSLAPDQAGREFSADKRLSLHQESSGGENWNSRNHINAEGLVLPRYRGYQLQHGKSEPQKGLRASPVLETRTPDSVISISLPHFWQNFPSALEADNGTLRAWLFPADRPEAYELQGGERKTQRVILGYGASLEQMAWSHSPMVPVLPAEHYENTQAFPWFRANQQNTRLDKLILEGLDGPSNFFSKRELIDEYGWRNFGDIFADHETLYQSEDEPLHISHYNNQYDAIYGFARQFALTGDPRWFELMDDLARHVSDIDIYHTTEDRVEYNNGLFWHTDHYLDAQTCTHRTFTRHNNTSSTPGQLGGGPAAEHCYTTGHLYHYWITGCIESRDTVLDLAHWITALHEGERGFLSEILALKKQELPKLKAMLRGGTVSSHRYPFTRGTGNYINTLLDAYLLQQDHGWLTQAEGVIKETIHPADNIEQRNLLDTETGWSYLVLLASIARYLLVKEEVNKRDHQWHYGRAAFLHYVDWMVEHERPFLEEPGDLEFANDTWVAQDIRKASLMFQAARENPESAERYSQKGEEWLDYVVSTLNASPERALARLQIILMQNYGPQHQSFPASEGRPECQTSFTLEDIAPTLGWAAIARQIISRLVNGLLHFSPRREKAWLQARLDR